jgi:hypothetical protein
MRSRGLSSTLSAIDSILVSADIAHGEPALVNEALSGGLIRRCSHLIYWWLGSGLAEQAQHSLVRLRCQRQRGGGELLAGLQSQHVGAFLVLSASTRLSAPVCSRLIMFL